MEKVQIVYEDFAKVDIRIARVVTVLSFERTHRPAYNVEVDFDPLGRKWSSAQITSYAADEPVIDADPEAPSFFWLAGQGGNGVMVGADTARLAASLAFGTEMPDARRSRHHARERLAWAGLRD